MSADKEKEKFREKESSFGRALSGVTLMRSFRENVLEPLKEQEEGIPRPEWRQKFRRELPFWKLLSSEQRRHIRSIFAHMLPDPDVDVSSFDPEERLMLDIVAEEYMRQALLFADTVESEEYRPKEHIDRDYPGRVLVLTLSSSLFFFDVPDKYGKRGYTYQNIYGNRSIPSYGRCRLKGGIHCGDSLLALEFHTSEVQLVADTEAMENRLREFDDESKKFHRSFSDTFHGISVKSRKSFSGFIQELTSSSQIDDVVRAPSPDGDGIEGEEDGSKDGESAIPDNVARLPLPKKKTGSQDLTGDLPGESRLSESFNTPPDESDN